LFWRSIQAECLGELPEGHLGTENGASGDIKQTKGKGTDEVHKGMG
jgi:hypothetical protein